MENNEKEEITYLTKDAEILAALNEGKTVTQTDSDEMIMLGRFKKVDGVICRLDRYGEIVEINASIQHRCSKYRLEKGE